MCHEATPKRSAFGEVGVFVPLPPTPRRLLARAQLSVVGGALGPVPPPSGGLRYARPHARGAVTCGARQAVSAEELVRTSLERIERLNPTINAVISVREQALDEARELEAGIAAGEDVGLTWPASRSSSKTWRTSRACPTTLRIPGVRGRAGGRRRRTDAAAPQGRRRDRGGQDEPAQFAFAGFTDNLLYGATRNPWNLEASPGGSSARSARRWPSRHGADRDRHRRRLDRSASRPARRGSSGSSRPTA